MKKIDILCILIITILSMVTIGMSEAQAEQPVLFFSDLVTASKTGWEGSGTKGAAVTIWGKNFGSTQGNSYVTVNGARITEYAEWGATGIANGIPRGLERITFWLNNNCQDGDGTITVTVNGVTSNALPFTVAPAKIYFVSVSTGNDSCNGLYATSQGGSNCPFKSIKMFNPGLNPSRDNESTIVYVRGGTYTELDVDSTFVALRGPYGASNRRHSLIAYPTEIPTLNAANAGRGVIWNAKYSPYGRNNYFTYSKLKVIGGGEAIDVWGDYNRVIGNHFEDMLGEAWAGVVMVDNSQYTQINGNYFYHNGYDSYKHNIYIKTHPNYVSGDKSAEYTYVGWNEFNDAYANDTHGGVIFISKASDASGKYTRYIWIHDNYFHDGNMEFIYTGDNTDISDIYIYNNIFKHGTCPNAGIFLAWHTRSVYLYNNTFYQIGGGSEMVSITGNTTAIFKSNIWYSKSGQGFLGIETYQGATFNSDSDLYYDPDGSIILPSGSGITMVNAKVGNPLFANAVNGDFHLFDGSPAINAGTNTVSTVVNSDYDGRNRGTQYDIGALEYAVGTEPLPSDTEAPSVPTGLVATAGSSTQINLSWNASTDNVGVTGYRIYRNGSSIGTSATTSYSDTGLSPSTTYTYTVAAYDAAGNTSGQSASASATTLASSPQQSTLTVNKSGTGSVTSSPAGIYCGYDCSEAYNAGTVVTLTASPDTGSIFTGWSGGGCTGTGICSISLNADTTVTANFGNNTFINYTITTRTGRGGGILPSGRIRVNNGTDQAFTIVPQDGYDILDVQVDGVSMGKIDTYTFRNVTRNHRINARFINYTITTRTGRGGSILPSGRINVKPGTDQTLTIVPQDGYDILDVQVDGVSMGKIDTYTFNNVTTNHRINAYFIRIIQ